MKRVSSSLSAIAIAAAAALLAAPLAAQAQSRDTVRVIVAYKSAASPLVRAAIAKLGGKIVLQMDDEDDMVAAVVPRAAVAVLAAMKNVEYVEDDVMRSIDRIQRPLAARKATPASATTTVQTVPYGIPMVQADLVSDASAGNRTICIIDSGINATHEDLAGISMTGKNFTASGSWNTDENSHGTHVAGTIAALNNSTGVVGVLPSGTIKLAIAKVFDASGSAATSVINKAIRWCGGRGGANVVSMSLGGSRGARSEKKAVEALAAKNILVIAAAGNTGTEEYHYPASFPSVVSVAAIDENKVVADFSTINNDVEIAGPGVGVVSTVPADSQTGASLSVGATAYTTAALGDSPRASANGPLADFAFGETPAAGTMTGKVCLISRGNISFADKALNCEASGGIGAIIYNNAAGPVNGTLSGAAVTIPVVEALQSDGALMLAQLGQTAAVSVFGLPDLYAAYSGTSMATPHVSAVAALVWSLHTSCTAEQIRTSLNNSAQDINAAGRDIYTGYGLVQAKAAHDRITALGCGV